MVDMGVKPMPSRLGESDHCAAPGARLCTHCKQPLDIPKDALLKEGFTEADLTRGLKIFAPKGCSNCTDGYKAGRYLQVLRLRMRLPESFSPWQRVEISDQAAKEACGSAARRARR